jgi:hypothetical protein
MDQLIYDARNNAHAEKTSSANYPEEIAELLFMEDG